MAEAYARRIEYYLSEKVLVSGAMRNVILCGFGMGSSWGPVPLAVGGGR